MTTIELILTITLGLVAIIAIIYYFIKALKNNYLNIVYDTIVKAMKEAESKFTDGEDKKKYVLEQVRECCKKVNIPYDFIATLISKTIEGIIKGYNSIIK